MPTGDPRDFADYYIVNPKYQAPSLPIGGFEKIDYDRYMADHPELKMTSKPPRADVYAAIDGERDYQDKQWKGPDHQHEVGAYITMLTYYVQKAQEAWTVKSGDYDALHVIRKIAGIAVHCMEEHGAPKRGEVINQDGEKIQTAN